MAFVSSSSLCLALFFLLLSLFYLSSSPVDQSSTTRDVDLGNPVLHFIPSVYNDDMTCERVRVVGLSMFNIKSYANSFQVTLTPSVAIPERLHSKIEVCFHRNSSLGLCQCTKDEWKTIQNGQWSAFMSAYDNRYVDVKIMGGSSGSITVSVEEEFQKWRLYCLIFGFILLLVAPIISRWVPFYYSSSMAVGVLLVVLIILFQGMKLLPTGRKSAFYFTIYGSLLGLASYILHYFSLLINSILANFGLSEDMYNPVSIFVGVGIVLSGAALGYWAVRKYIVSDDGSVDAGVAQFVKWAVRIIALASILQSTPDTRLAVLGLVSCWGISAEVQRWCTRWNKMSGNVWQWKAKPASGGRKRREFLGSSARPHGKSSFPSPKNGVPFTASPSKGFVSPSIKGARLTPQQDYYSTFHKTPKRRRFTKNEWENFTTESTKESLAELTASPEFIDWMVENADRIQLQSEDSSDDSMDSGAVSSQETVLHEETVDQEGSKMPLFSWR